MRYDIRLFGIFNLHRISESPRNNAKIDVGAKVEDNGGGSKRARAHP